MNMTVKVPNNKWGKKWNIHSKFYTVVMYNTWLWGSLQTFLHIYIGMQKSETTVFQALQIYYNIFIYKQKITSEEQNV